MKKGYLITAGVLFTSALILGGLLAGTAFAGINRSGWMMGGSGDCSSTGMMNSEFGMTNGGMMGSGFNHENMMGGGFNHENMMGGSMMNGFVNQTAVEPLTLAEAHQALTTYLSARGDSSLEIGEIMIFSNHAYAAIRDRETRRGAFEVLIDPLTLRVSPEPGPNMMWNTEYGMMAAGSNSAGMMGNGMMGFSAVDPEVEAAITAEEAVTIAQRYLDENNAGLTVDDHADSLPGYFTLHVEKDGKVIGMLGVNAYTGQVFYHHWHGSFIEMSAGE